MKRNIFLHLNKFQRKILLPVLISSLAACNVIVLSLALFYFPADHTLIPGLTVNDLKFFLPWLLLTVSLIIVFLIFWTYYISNRMVGPYGRVLKDLDDVVAGKSKKEIKARKGDEMFEELLKRVNTLIRKLPE